MKEKKTNKNQTKGVTVLRQGANSSGARNVECEQHGGNCCQAGWCCERVLPE